MWVVHVTRLVVSNWRTWLRVIPLALVVVALTVSSGITNARQLSDEQKNIASYGSTSGLFSLQEDVPPGTPVPIPRNNHVAGIGALSPALQQYQPCTVR